MKFKPNTKLIGKVVMVDDLTQTLVVQVGNMRMKQFMPPTHYACLERTTGSAIKDHLILNSPLQKHLLMNDFAMCEMCCAIDCVNSRRDFPELYRDNI